MIILTDEETKEIADSFSTGEKQVDLAERFNCSYSRIRATLIKAGLIAGPKNKKPRQSRTMFKRTECKCPNSNCARPKHYMKIFWAGELPAPKFCSSCLRIASYVRQENPQLIGALSNEGRNYIPG